MELGAKINLCTEIMQIWCTHSPFSW